jgi:hypothetical protein
VNSHTQPEAQPPSAEQVDSTIDVGDRGVSVIMLLVVVGVCNLRLRCVSLLDLDNLGAGSWWWYQHAVRAVPYDRRPLLGCSATHSPRVRHAFIVPCQARKLLVAILADGFGRGQYVVFSALFEP